MPTPEQAQGLTYEAVSGLLQAHTSEEAYAGLNRPDNDCEPSEEQLIEDRSGLEYLFRLEQAEGAINEANKAIRGEMLGAKGSTVTVLAGTVGEAPGRQYQAAAAIHRDVRRDGYYGDKLGYETAQDVKSGLKPKLGVQTNYNVPIDRSYISTVDGVSGVKSYKTYENQTLIKRLDGSEVMPNDETLTSVEKLRLFMHDDLFGDKGSHSRPADYVGNSTPKWLSRIVGGKELDPGQSKPELTPELLEEVRDILPAILDYGEYKMLQWHGNTGFTGDALGVVEELVDIDPQSVHGLDLQPTLDRLVIMSAALDYDVANRKTGYDRRKSATEQLVGTRSLLSRISALQAWQTVAQEINN